MAKCIILLGYHNSWMNCQFFANPHVSYKTMTNPGHIETIVDNDTGNSETSTTEMQQRSPEEEWYEENN